MDILSTLLILVSVSRSTFAIGPDADLFIVNGNVAPDGFTRSATLAGSTSTNGQLPGPLITANQGDFLNINVHNQLSDGSMMKSTSIHWHGMFQEGTAWADGAAGVTQCPIAPGNSYLYSFSVPDQAGTYWYHSHYSAQYCDGLRGPLIIYEKPDPLAQLYDFDNESTIITLADWYHLSARDKAVLTPNSTLINGLGRYASGPKSPLSVIQVQHGKRYRMRLISISCDSNFVFSIDGHDMTIIETDGVKTKQTKVDSLQIYVAQRYSFILNANQPVGNYWIRANPNIGPTGFDGGINSAVLRYVGAPEKDPLTTQQKSLHPLLETNLHPLATTPVPGAPFSGGANISLNFEFGLNTTTGQWMINGATFVPPTLPVLLQILSGAKTAQELLPSGDVYVLPTNAVVELSVKGGGRGAPHPFHLHGHDFWVVRSAGSTTYNYHNPILRDVVSTGFDGDNVTIRFVTDNTGPWILHCHINWHLNRGLAVVFAEDVPRLAHLGNPPEWDQLCPIFNALPPDEH